MIGKITFKFVVDSQNKWKNPKVVYLIMELIDHWHKLTILTTLTHKMAKIKDFSNLIYLLLWLLFKKET